MNMNDVDDLFEHKKGDFDIYEPNANHEMRFFKKLDSQNNKVIPLTPKKNRKWGWATSIAASITLALGLITTQFDVNARDLANVSPKMEETQSFFISAIDMQLEKIDAISAPESKKLIEDAMTQLDKLENDYEGLKKDLLISGNDERVISSMIKNFQKRSDLLDNLLEQIQTLKTLKTTQNETNFL